MWIVSCYERKTKLQSFYAVHTLDRWREILLATRSALDLPHARNTKPMLKSSPWFIYFFFFLLIIIAQRANTQTCRSLFSAESSYRLGDYQLIDFSNSTWIPFHKFALFRSAGWSIIFRIITSLPGKTWWSKTSNAINVNRTKNEKLGNGHNSTLNLCPSRLFYQQITISLPRNIDVARHVHGSWNLVAVPKDQGSSS